MRYFTTCAECGRVVETTVETGPEYVCADCDPPLKPGSYAAAVTGIDRAACDRYVAALKRGAYD